MRNAINTMLLVSLGFIMASCQGAGNTENGGETDSLESTPTVVKEITKEEMISAWRQQVGYDVLDDMDMPETYLFYDVDKDGQDEVLMSGFGFNAAFINQDGKLLLVAQSFGEFEDLAVSDEGDVVRSQVSGMSVEVVTWEYYRLKDSKLSYVFVYSTNFEDPDNEESTLLKSYSLASGDTRKELTEAEAEAYYPKTLEKSITGLEGWQEF